MKNHQAERDEFIREYHIEPEPSGLKCPLCGKWQPLGFDSPQGVHMDCVCGLKTIMPRVQLVRAIKNIRKSRA